MELLSLAYALSLLTYSLGAILFGSPLPIRSVKRWGVLMMYDGLASAVLVSVYSLLLKLGDYLLGVVGASWPFFMSWLTGRTATLVASYLAIQSLAAALKVSGGDVLLELLRHVGSLIATSLTAIKMVYLISAIAFSLRDKILAIGILLYTLPMRVGKGVGAAMISLSIVYYIGLPLMPVFAQVFEAPPVPIAGGRYGAVSGTVVDALDRPLPYAVVKLYKDSRDPIVVVLGDPEGRFYAGPPQDLLASGERLKVEVVFMGYILEADPQVVEVPWSGRLKINNVLYLGGGFALLVVGIVQLSALNVSQGSVELKLTALDPQTTLSPVKLKAVRLDWFTVDDSAADCRWSSFSWGGLEFEECHLALGAGEHRISVGYSGAYLQRPEVEERRYGNAGDVLEYINMVQTAAVSYLYSYLLLPSAYLVILSASSYALSRFLGGGLRLRVL